jgi:hypothetical protein
VTKVSHAVLQEASYHDAMMMMTMLIFIKTRFQSRSPPKLIFFFNSLFQMHHDMM